MKLAIIGSRNLKIKDLSEYLPEGVTEIVSGGAKGIDTVAAEYAHKNNLMLREFLPEYNRYGKRAPLVRNGLIAEYADEALALWDGKSHGTLFTIKQFERLGKKVTVIVLNW